MTGLQVAGPFGGGGRAAGRAAAASLPTVALAAVVGYVCWFVWALEYGDYNAWATLLIAPALVLGSVPLLRRAVRAEADRRVRQVIAGAFFLKLAMAFVNYAVAFGVYGGVADARGYHDAGSAYATAFRAGDFALAGDGELGRRFVNALTGVVYTATGPSRLGGYLIFSWVAFWGLYLLYRGFTLAVPTGDARRYALLVFLWPSTLFWTSAIGKEAWMTLALGASALGVACLLTRRRGGLTMLTLGLVASALVRPHVSVMILVAVLAGYLLRRSPSRSALGPVASLAGLVALLALGSLTAGQFGRHFEVSFESAGSVLDTAERESEIGGSAFDTQGLPLPLAAVGVLVRPLPFEAHNGPALVASAEGTALLLMLAVSRRRLRSAVSGFLAAPYLVFCAVYSAVFLVAFSVFRNFGTLARERVQLLPFLFVLLALPAARRVRPVGRFGLAPLQPWLPALEGTEAPVAERPARIPALTAPPAARDQVRVLALVLTYDAPEALVSCVRAIDAQSRPPDEIVVIDNAGIPPAAEVLARAGLDGPGLTVVRQVTNGGPAGGHAAGLRRLLRSEHDLAWVMDDGYLPDAGCLEALLAEASERDAPAFVVPRCIRPGGADPSSPAWCGVLLDRRIVDEVGLPMEDLFWWGESGEYLEWRIPRAGHRLVRGRTATVRELRAPTDHRGEPWRYYYQARNDVFLQIHVKRSPGPLPRTLIRLVFRALGRRRARRAESLAMIARGVADGVLRRLGRRADIGP